MSLRWRFALVLAVVVAAVVVTLSTAAWLSAKSEIVSGVDDALRRQANSAARGFFVGSPPENENRRRQGPDPVQILDRQGSVLAAVGKALPVEAEDQAVAAGTKNSITREVTVGGDDYRMVTLTTQFGAVQVARNKAEIDDALGGLRNGLIALGALATVLAALVGWWLAGRFTRPIVQLTSTTEHIAKTGDLTEPIALDRTDEVGRLASSFDAMLHALAASQLQQQQLVMDASHELRTPLTTLRTNIELLAKRPGLDPEQRQELLEAATVELEELSSLVTELVDFAIERRPEDMDREDVDLGALAEDVVHRAERRYGRTFPLEIEDPAIIDGFPTLLERALSNLLDNASKFSPRDEPIEVSVRGGEIVVRDHGPGVDPDDRNRVFDRFYRTAAARTMPGSGLGLAIVRQIITQHGGTVRFEDAPGGGALVRIELPDAREPEDVPAKPPTFTPQAAEQPA
jgi:two-component system, OmpR family, sensor histidine kinase MprB